jgi:D-tyrosyl-tRNA(Tyr) deacylase
MRAILQRVSSASVRVEEEVVGEISRGILVLLAVEKGDGEEEARILAQKIASMRIFPDADGRMNLDLSSIGGAVLVVSQFTLAASLARGRRPSFNNAADPGLAQPLVESVMLRLAANGLKVAGGRFGAAMKVELLNDGPVTFCLDVRGGKVI